MKNKQRLKNSASRSRKCLPVSRQEKDQHKKERTFQSEDLAEFATASGLLMWILGRAGSWKALDCRCAGGIRSGRHGRQGGAERLCGLCAFRQGWSPLAVVEAKRASKDPNNGWKQAVLYADCLERKFGRRPMIFITNGFETYFWDDQTSPKRQVSGIFSKMTCKNS